VRLAKPFYKLPIRFDVERMQAEIAALPVSAWARHPNDIAGNSTVRLISVGGEENDAVDGEMRPTAHLAQSPYLRQVLASFGVVWSRSRLLRLAAGAGVPEHSDINYHWFNRVRVHIPVITRPEVRFHCGGESLHMAAGEAWIFDNWRLHRVENPTPDERIHLVADTSGSAAFWQLVSQSELPDTPVRQHQLDPEWNAEPLTERTSLAAVMTPAEVDLLVLDLRSELQGLANTAEYQMRLARYHATLDGFCRDWRQLYALHGDAPSGWPQFARLRDHLRNASRTLGEGLVVRTNRVGAHKVLEGRVLRAALAGPAEDSREPLRPAAAHSGVPQWLSRPAFIVAAPRSGSTLLFETLASSTQVCTLGGEAHGLVEGAPELRLGARGVDSNRLLAGHCTEAIASRLLAQIVAEARDSAGRRVPSTSPLQFIEKTPKNALRIPFFDRLFPAARFVFLWRDPRESISSIMEAWRSGRWKTYNGLSGFDGPWSLLLPPGWSDLRGAPLEEIAAFQWECTNRIVLDDLAALPAGRWMAVHYRELLDDAAATIARVCEFLGMSVDAALARRLSAPLPHSNQTLTPPDAHKWRSNEAAVQRVLPRVEATWQRLRGLSATVASSAASVAELKTVT
jgi:hypothetical protein